MPGLKILKAKKAQEIYDQHSQELFDQDLLSQFWEEMGAAEDSGDAYPLDGAFWISFASDAEKNGLKIYSIQDGDHRCYYVLAKDQRVLTKELKQTLDNLLEEVA